MSLGAGIPTHQREVGSLPDDAVGQHHPLCSLQTATMEWHLTACRRAFLCQWQSDEFVLSVFFEETLRRRLRCCAGAKVWFSIEQMLDGCVYRAFVFLAAPCRAALVPVGLGETLECVGHWSKATVKLVPVRVPLPATCMAVGDDGGAPLLRRVERELKCGSILAGSRITMSDLAELTNPDGQADTESDRPKS